MTLISNLINGISLGSVYAIIALGYTMVYGIAKMLNFAHGDVIMVGAYVSYICSTTLGIPTVLSILISMAVCTVLGILIEGLAYRPLRKATSLAVLITAIGVSYFLQNAALIIWGSTPRAFTSVVPFKSISLFDGKLIITPESLVTVATCVLIMLGLTFFTKKGKMGKAMRAVSEDKDAALLMGINTNRTISMTFAIGSALAAIAGVLLCSAYPVLITDHRLNARYKGVYGGGFRRYRLNSRRYDRRHTFGRYQKFSAEHIFPPSCPTLLFSRCL